MSVEMSAGIRLSGSALRPRRFQFQLGSFKQRKKEMKINTNEEGYRLPAMDFALLGDYPIQFWQHLSERGYADDTIRVYLRCIGRLAEMMKADGVAVGGLDEAQAVALVARTSWIQKRKIAATFIVRCFVRFLGTGCRKTGVAAHGQGNRTGGFEAGLRDLPAPSARAERENDLP
jgi:hypothetical protein